MAQCSNTKRSGQTNAVDGRAPQETDFAVFLQRHSSNVDVALMCFAQAKTRLFKSGSKYLICLYNLVAGTGFEPVTFRL